MYASSRAVDSQRVYFPCNEFISESGETNILTVIVIVPFEGLYGGVIGLMLFFEDFIRLNYNFISSLYEVKNAPIFLYKYLFKL